MPPSTGNSTNKKWTALMNLWLLAVLLGFALVRVFGSSMMQRFLSGHVR